MIERPEVDDGSREELAEYFKNQQSDTLCASCGNTSCPLETKDAKQCVEYYPLTPDFRYATRTINFKIEDVCPNPTTTTT